MNKLEFSGKENCDNSYHNQRLLRLLLYQALLVIIIRAFNAKSPKICMQICSYALKNQKICKKYTVKS